MSLQVTKKTNRLKIFGITSAIVLGTSFIVLSTFPHLKTSIYNYIAGDNEVDTNDNEPIAIDDNNESDEPEANGDIRENGDIKQSHDIAEESMIDVNEWSNDNLKSWLKEVRILS